MVSDVNSIRRQLRKLGMRILSLQEKEIMLKAEWAKARLRNNYHTKKLREKNKEEKVERRLEK